MKKSNNLHRLFLLLLVMLFSFTQAKAQVGEIKKSSPTSSTSKSNDRGTTGGGSPCTDACFGACAAGCLDFCFSNAASWAWNSHKRILGKKDKIPSIVSLEVMPVFGISGSNTYMFMPRARVTWGLFTTDYRYFSMIEDMGGEEGVDTYTTHDWQVLVLNPVVIQPLTMRIGTGFMYEQFSRNIYSDFFLGFDIRGMEERVIVNLEGRYATDYVNPTARAEGSIKANLELAAIGAFHPYLTAGILYQNYYQHVNVIGFQLGFNLMLK